MFSVAQRKELAGHGHTYPIKVQSTIPYMVALHKRINGLL